ncbi:DUF1905 domain-containing protein [Acidobacteria bacterium AB60]|nr:DUF1905 domain-containing protein [Acidobacteria bacterium AB60]
MPTFKATISIRGINPFVLVSATHAAALKPGWRKPLPALVRINGLPTGAPHRINLMPAGDGTFYLYLNGIIRTQASVSVGDRVSVEIQFDPAYRNGPQHPMPRWFKQALDQNPPARSNWMRLPPSRQKEVLRYLAQLKSAEARARNLDRALSVLSGIEGRFMARTWTNGS